MTCESTGNLAAGKGGAANILFCCELVFILYALTPMKAQQTRKHTKTYKDAFISKVTQSGIPFGTCPLKYNLFILKFTPFNVSLCVHVRVCTVGVWVWV